MITTDLSVKLADQPPEALLVELLAAYKELEAAKEELQVQNEELKSSRETLEAERQRYRDLFDLAPHAYLVTDTKGVIAEANLMAAELLAVERDKLPGKPLSRYLAPRDRHILHEHLAALKAGEGMAQWEMRLLRRGGQTIDVAIHVSSAGSASGTATALRWLVRDITKRKQIQAQQEQLMAQLADERRMVEEVAARDEAILASLTEGLIIFDLNGQVLQMNRAALRLHGYDHVEHVRRNLADYGPLFTLSDMDGRLLPMDEWPMARVLRGEAFSTSEARVHDLRTGQKWIGSYGGTPVRDRNGEVILGIVTVRNVTAKREGEAEIRRQRAFLERLIESAPLGIAVVRGADNRYEVVNRQFQLLIGAPNTDVLGRTVTDVLPEAEAADWIRLYDQVRHTGQPVCLQERRPAPVTAGETGYLEVDLVPLTDAGGQVEGVLTLLNDVTEDVIAQEALLRQKEELQALAEELEAYDYTVAHDLKSPLSMIVSSADLLATALGGLYGHGPQQKLNNILYAARRMNEIVESLLLLTSTRGAVVPSEPLNMEEIVAGARRELAGMIERRGAEVRCPGSWPRARGYSPWVQSAWANYLSNALKYGGDPPRIELGAQDEGDGMVRFWVRDHGPGLTEDEQARLFTTFSRLDRPSKLGHGLGLAIVRRIAEKLGGQAGVESSVGGGSTFWFTLPRA